MKLFLEIIFIRERTSEYHREYKNKAKSFNFKGYFFNAKNIEHGPKPIDESFFY